MTDSLTNSTDDSAKVESGLEVTGQSKSEILIHPLSPELEYHQNSNNNMVKLTVYI